MQMWHPSEEEIAAHQAIVDEFNNSADIEDKICAILMDSRIGRQGWTDRAVVKTKAAAIMLLFETFKPEVIHDII